MLAISRVFLAKATEVVLLSGCKAKRLATNLVNSGDQQLGKARLFLDASKMTMAEAAEVFGQMSKGLIPPVFSSKAVTPKDHQSVA